MKIIKSLLICFFIGVCLGADGLAFDWKSLHERYRDMPVTVILEGSGQRFSEIENWYMQGLHFLDDRDNPRAQEAFGKVLQVDPYNLAAQWGLAEVLRREYRYEESVERLNAVINSDPYFVPAYLTLAYIHYVQLSFKESAQLCAQVFSMDARKVDRDNLLRAHGLYAANQGMLAKRAAVFKKPAYFFSMQKHLSFVRKTDPQSFVALMGEASYYMAIPPFLGRDLKKAEELFLKALVIEPRNPEVYVRLSQIYSHEGKQKKADDYFNKALAIDARNKMVLDHMNRTCHFICLEK